MIVKSFTLAKPKVIQTKEFTNTNDQSIYYDDRNALFSHMLDFKHTFKFSQATLIKLIHCRN